jgi:iron complex transport system substrate-binding protein
MRHLIFIIFFLILSCSDNDRRIQREAESVTDDLGIIFNFKNAPDKVISLAPNLTEFIYALGSDSQLIADTRYCNFPEDAKNKIKVGDLISVDYEKIVSLNPDLIFITVEGNSKASYEKLKELGYKVFVSNPRNYEGIKKTLRDIAAIFGKSETADSIITDWDKKYNKIKIESDKRRNLSGMFAVSINPLMLGGGKTFITEFLTDCGLKNIAADSPANYPVFNREEILRVNPDVMIFTDENNLDVSYLLQIYPEWENLDAIKYKRIIEVNADLYFRPGPRFIIALDDLNRRIIELTD